MKIFHGCIDMCMAQELFERHDICAHFQKVGRIGMAKAMGGHLFYNLDHALGFVMPSQNANKIKCLGLFGTEAWLTITVSTKMFINT
jgi:hypothetical protein